MGVALHIRARGALAACVLASGGLLLGSAASWGQEPSTAPTPGADVAPELRRLFRESARLDRLAAAYAAYYKLPADVAPRLLRIGLTPDDVSVALWIARRSVADPHAVAATRVKTGMSWVQVMRAYGVRTKALAVRLDGPRPDRGPYARPYRVLAGQARGPLTDAEVRDLVQLRLLSEHYRVRPSRVIARRGAGASPTDLVLEAQAAAGAKPSASPSRGRP